MSKLQTSIYIVLAFDGGFWAPAYATMRSVCLFSHRRSDLVFHLCCRTVSDRQRQILNRISEEFGATIVWHDIDRNEAFRGAVASLKHSRRLGKVIYARLMLERFLPSEAKRAIYLDCDMMVREPIERLFEIALEGKSIGAVRDPLFPLISMGGDLFDPAQRYFNSGMLLIDLEKWRQAQVWERFRSMIEDGIMARIYYDQDVLNIVFKQAWHELDHRWNLIDPRPAHQALDPFILHFTGERKPWNLVSRVAFARLYRHVMTNEIFYTYWRERVSKRLGRFLPLKGRPT